MCGNLDAICMRKPLSMGVISKPQNVFRFLAVFQISQRSLKDGWMEADGVSNKPLIFERNVK